MSRLQGKACRGIGAVNGIGLVVAKCLAHAGAAGVLFDLDKKKAQTTPQRFVRLPALAAMLILKKNIIQAFQSIGE